MTLQFATTRYDAMPYRRCGRSGLLLPAISLGAWETFGGYRGEDTARECLFRAFDLGITHFDLANNYGTPPGNAEIVCGKIIKEMPRDELIISSKAGYRMWPGPYGEWGSRKYLIASCDQSLQRMGLEYVDIFYPTGPTRRRRWRRRWARWTCWCGRARRSTPASAATAARSSPTRCASASSMGYARITHPPAVLQHAQPHASSGTCCRRPSAPARA